MPSAHLFGWLARGLDAWLTSPRRLPASLRQRACQGRAWRKAFPGAPKADIRLALALFGDAFAIHPTHRLKLHPDDRPQAIYQARYPHRWQPDALEFEALHADALRIHGVDLQPLWHADFTLADLLRALAASSTRPPQA
jgi:propanediol dehydratase small subunit